MMIRVLSILICVIISLDSFTQNTKFKQDFLKPPLSYRPGCFYYWISDNISVEGVTNDIKAMAEVGIGRAFIGNVGFPYEQDMFLRYGNVKLFSQEWWKITQAAVKAGSAEGVDVGFFNSPGWSQSGGPWVKHTQSMRYLASQETDVVGPGWITYQFDKSDLFQEVSVLAFPMPVFENDFHRNKIKKIKASIDGIDFHSLFDGDTTSVVALPSGSKDFSISVEMNSSYETRSLVIFPARQSFKADVSIQEWDGNVFRTIKSFCYDRSNFSLNVGFKPTAPVVISFPKTVSNEFRLEFTKLEGNGGFAEIAFSNASILERYEEKQLAKMVQKPLPSWEEYQWDTEMEESDQKSIVSQTQILDITRKVSKNGLLKWYVPQGKWVIIRYGMLPTGMSNAAASPEGRGYEVDKMNKQAIQDHFQNFIKKIQDKIPKSDKRAFKYVVADSYETGSQNWTDNMVISFQESFGYDPTKWLPVLSGRVVESKEMSNRFLWDLRRFIANKIAYDYVGGLRDICNRNGLELWLENYGHWGFPSEFLMYGGQSNEVAGEFWAEGNLGSVECRAASSAAHIYGKNSVSAESFTADRSPYSRHPGVLKKRGDWSFTEGINNTIFHVYIHQPTDTIPGINAWFGTEFNRHNTWFKQGKAFVEYIHRCNFMLQQGKPVNDIAFFIGEDAPKMTGSNFPHLPSGYQFDYINAEVIEQRLRVENGKFVLPDGMSYRLLVLPELETMRPELLKKIFQLVNDGGAILGTKPLRSPSLHNYPLSDSIVKSLGAKLWQGLDGKINKVSNVGKGKVMTGLSMEDALQEIKLVPDFVKNTPANILFAHRSTVDKEIYFISNQEDTTIRFEALFREGVGQPYFYDPVTGSIRVLKGFSVETSGKKVLLELAAFQSCFVVIDNTENATPANVDNFPEPYTVHDVNPEWMVTFDTSMRGPLAPVHFNRLVDWSMHENEYIRNYSGKAIYKGKFYLDSLVSGSTIFIDLGKVNVIATVKINDKKIGTVWTAPWQIDATGAIKEGENEIEIEVVNTWVNRLVADSRLPESQRRTWINYSTIKPDTPYEPSGLIGPVKIVSYDNF